VRVVHRGDKNLRFAPYEEIMHLSKIVLYGFYVQICNVHGYIHTSKSPSSFNCDMREWFKESATDLVSLYVYGICIMLVINLISKSCLYIYI
jgi:hypothetical protein